MADYARIRAPFAGVITRRFVDKGAFIQSASSSQNAEPIVTVSSVDTVRVYIRVPESESSFIHAGTRVKIMAVSAPDGPIKASVTRVSSALDLKTRTMIAEVDLPNPNRLLLSGAYVTAKLDLETHTGVVAVPSGGIGSEKSGKFVYAVVQGKAKRIPVTVGFNDGAFTEVREGLKGTEEVVIEGRDALTPGAPVKTSKWEPKKKKPK